MTAQFWVDPFYATHDAAETKSLKFKTLYNMTVDEYFLAFCLKLLMALVGIGGLFFIQNHFSPQITNGTSAMATVIECSVDGPGGRENDTVNFSFEYMYDNKTLQPQKSVTGDFIHAYSCNDFPKGSSIKIQFQPDSPTNVEIIDSRVSIPPSEVNQMNIIIIITALYGVFVIYEFVRRIRKYQTFRRSGIILLGEIRNTQYEKSSSKSERYMKIEYQFLTPENVLKQAIFRPHRNYLADRPLPEPGSVVSVFYLNRKNFHLL